MKRFCYLLLLSSIIFSFKPHELTWVAIGDSITYLNDHKDETGNRVTKGYLTLVSEKLPFVHYVNQGHNGWTAGQIAQHIDSLGIVNADVYTVFLGTNDWWAGRPIGSLSDYKMNSGNNSIYGSFRIIIDKLRMLNPNAHIVLITPMQRTDFVYINDMKNNAYGDYKPKANQLLEQVVNAIDSIGESEHLVTVDLYHNKKLAIQKLVNYKKLKDTLSGLYKNYKYPNYINIPFNPVTDEYPYPPAAVNVTFDGLHPSDKGYAIIAGILIRIFENFEDIKAK